eukprot:CAMPEP_0184873416 /NCGR_PEP_ID=MMETSP0580-20130426/41831_1 /TAXON_ID=1118495 /ORGANISM="Dactyliosolen fragilissimus" /LENGTH=135 /DNA_ID=CAMNT_0027376319 /DNA_START=741 /DNA_END=1149 /DNA_ORIENTATION=-
METFLVENVSAEGIDDEVSEYFYKIFDDGVDLTLSDEEVLLEKESVDEYCDVVESEAEEEESERSEECSLAEEEELEDGVVAGVGLRACGACGGNVDAPINARDVSATCMPSVELGLEKKGIMGRLGSVRDESDR